MTARVDYWNAAPGGVASRTDSIDTSPPGPVIAAMSVARAVPSRLQAR